MMENGKDPNFKRLDEVYGRLILGRKIASVETSLSQKKSSTPEVTKPFIKVNPIQLPDLIDPISPASPSFVMEDLNFKLSGISTLQSEFNLPIEQITGQLVCKNGAIESFQANLPNGEQFSFENSEITDNVFQYQYKGETLKGMIYIVSENTYMISLSDGPWAGTRYTFEKEAPSP
jgi:hypothetical protein